MVNNVITVAAAQFLSAPPKLQRVACQINTVCIDSHSLAQTLSMHK